MCSSVRARHHYDAEARRATKRSLAVVLEFRSRARERGEECGAPKNGVLRRNCDPRRASGAARAKTTDEDARYAGKRRENDETRMKEYKEYS